MKVLVTALTNLLPDGVPKEIVFIPAGSHKIFPQSHPKGVVVNLPEERGVEIAAAFHAELQKRMGENVKPWFDFEHTRKFPAAGYPTAFRYEQGKGIMAAVDWSASGSKAIEGKDVGYFSPEFYLGKDGVPLGIPERGPLGGLVTEPAFREIPPVAASDAEHPDSDPHPTKPSMKLILAALGLSIPEADTNAETHAVAAIDRLKASVVGIKPLEDERDGLKTTLTAAETTIKTLRGKQGEELFERAVAAGLVAKDDAEAKSDYVKASQEGNDFALKILGERITAASDSSDSPLSVPLIKDGVKASNGKTGEHAFILEARNVVTAGRAKSEVEAYQIVANEKPALYESYNSQFVA